MNNPIQLIIPPYTSITESNLSKQAAYAVQQRCVDLQNINKQEYEREVANQFSNNPRGNFYYERYQLYKSIILDDCNCVVEYLNGGAFPELAIFDLPKSAIYEQTLLIDNALLQSLPAFNLLHLIRCYQLEEPRNTDSYLDLLICNEPLSKQTDLRVIAELLTKANYPDAKQKIMETFFVNLSLFALKKAIKDYPENLWPFFAENSIFVDEALGLVEQGENKVNYKLENVLTILNLYPVMPERYHSALLTIALSDSKVNAPLAQQILSTNKTISVSGAEAALLSSKSQIRTIAADWLRQIGTKQSIKKLYKTLEQEKNEAVVASVLGALQTLGEDITEYISPDVLLVQAKKGLSAKRPVSIDWLTLDMLPSLTWAKGGYVMPEIILWWIVLAVKLKQSSSHPLFELYLAQLDRSSQQRLSQKVLELFIEYDTKTLSLSEAEQKVKDEVADYFERYKSFYPDATLAQASEQLLVMYMHECIGSAINCKGMLALITAIDIDKAIKLISAYIKKHSSRRIEISAVLEAVACIHHPRLWQFLFAIAKKSGPNTIRKKARNLLEKIALDHGWSFDYLVEHIVADAGLNQNGELIFAYGSRAFIATLDMQCHLVLKNESGKVVKSLPVAQKDEDADLVKSYQSQFAESKKELKQIVKDQTSRLYNMMCIERHWDITEWQQNVYSHPILRRLSQNLIWFRLNQQGQIIDSFRPINTDEMIRVDGKPITLNADEQIALAHNVYFNDEENRAWQTHFSTFGITPLFEQLTNLLPTLSNKANITIDDLVNTPIDSKVLKNTLNQLGYKKLDDGRYDSYHYQIYSYHFEGLNIIANIAFCDNLRFESGIKLQQLYFTQPYGYRFRQIALCKVPKVILAETYALYMRLATF